MDHSVTLPIIVKCFRLAIRIDVDEKQNSKKENNSQVDVRLANWRIWKKPLKKENKTRYRIRSILDGDSNALLPT